MHETKTNKTNATNKISFTNISKGKRNKTFINNILQCFTFLLEKLENLVRKRLDLLKISFDQKDATKAFNAKTYIFSYKKIESVTQI